MIFKLETRTVRARILLNGKDVTPYLYGNAVRILGESQRGLTKHELRSLHQQVATQPRLASMFGVSLSTITRPEDVSTGQEILHVNENGQKTLFRVSNIEPGSDGTTLYTTTILPKAIADYQGFFPANHLVIPEKDYDLYNYGIYFLYSNKFAEKTRERKPSFFEQMQDKAGLFKCLVECWCIAHAPEGTFEKCWSHDSFTMFWGPEFQKKHGNRFDHVNVGYALDYVSETGDLHGISRVYDTRRTDFMGKPKVDKITPLMEQMQADILQKLLEDETMFARIFPKNASKYWKQRLRVIVEMFYAPRDLALGKGSNSTHQPFRNLEDLEPKKQRQLSSIIHIIERDDTEPGLLECAKQVFERLMGRPYSKNFAAQNR